MPSTLFGILALLAISPQATIPAPTTAPSRSSIRALETYLTSSIQWPRGARPLDDYDRHYYWSAEGEAVVGAQFILAKRSGKGRVFSTVKPTFVVMDGGCSVVNVTFFGAGDARNRLACGGR